MLFCRDDGSMVYTIVNPDVDLAIKNLVGSSKSAQFFLEYNPDDILYRFMAGIRVVDNHRIRGIIDRIELAHLSLSIWPDQSKIAKGCLSLWVDESCRQQGFGRVLLGQTTALIEMTLSGLRRVYPCQVATHGIAALEIDAKSHPDPYMEPRLDSALWYQILKTTLLPQGFEEKQLVNCNCGEQEPKCGLPYLSRTIEI